jgi:hypothetical protein
MRLINRLAVSVVDIVTCPCTDGRITLTHPAVGTEHEIYSLQKYVERMKNQLKELL